MCRICMFSFWARYNRGDNIKRIQFIKTVQSIFRQKIKPMNFKNCRPYVSLNNPYINLIFNKCVCVCKIMILILFS